MKELDEPLEAGEEGVAAYCEAAPEVVKALGGERLRALAIMEAYEEFERVGATITRGPFLVRVKPPTLFRPSTIYITHTVIRR